MATSLAGSAMAPVALAFAVLDSGGSATDLGIVAACGVVAVVGCLLGGGVAADRLPRRVVLVGADVVCGVAQVVFAVLVLTGVAELWSMALLAAVRGASAAFHQPALAALPAELVPPDRLQRANSLLELARSVPQVAGPALAGVLVAVGGAGFVLLVDAASYLVSAAFLAGVRTPGRGAPTTSPWRDLREGWTEFRARRWLWTTVLQLALWNLLVVSPFLVLGPVVAERDLGGAWAWGLVSAAQGAGAVLAGVALLRLRVRRPLLVTTAARLTRAPLLVALALPSPVPLVALAAFAVGSSSGLFFALWRTTTQTLVPPHALARVSAYELFGAFALGPIGLALVGPVSERLGTAPVLWTAAAWQVLSCCALLLLPDVRGLRLNRPRPE
ncbi:MULTISPECIES: MFS transporter [Actinosynnema]|uniref:MFS transporter n=1 Tax=Actinosynnema TaxID=40566 RepID=UPI0020A2EA7E|nr:MFS transporter [Actinosynnema pretiosum]